MKTKLLLLCILILLGAAGFISVKYYSIVFARDVTGEVVGVERVTQPETIISSGGSLPNSQVFSFAVAIRDQSGEIVTASTEDRQWAVVQKGQCAEAKFLRYPPWHLEKAGTYFGARLLKLMDCPAKK